MLSVRKLPEKEVITKLFGQRFFDFLNKFVRLSDFYENLEIKKIPLLLVKFKNSHLQTLQYLESHLGF